MQTVKWFFNSMNYGFYCLYSFTLIDVIKKIVFDEFYLTNATNLIQFILTLIGVFFAYFRLRSYMRDSKIKTAILEQDLITKERANFPYQWNKEFIEPFNIEENDNK